MKLTEESWFERIWRLITPELVYFGIIYLVNTAMGVYWAYSTMENYISADQGIDINALTAALMEWLISNAMLLQTIGAFIAVFFLLRMYFKDYKKRRFVFDKSSVGAGQWVLLIPAGMFAALAGNMLMNLTDFAAESEGFQEAEQMLFSGSLIVQIIGIGIVIPICEELVYRGLIYMRMRQYMNVNASIVFSSLIFGFIHGNIVQAIYSFLIGILFAYVYEKYGSLKAPMAAHISANMLSLGLMICLPELETGMGLMFPGVVAVILCAATVGLIDKKVAAERVYLA